MAFSSFITFSLAIVLLLSPPSSATYSRSLCENRVLKLAIDACSYIGCVEVGVTNVEKMAFEMPFRARRADRVFMGKDTQADDLKKDCCASSSHTCNVQRLVQYCQLSERFECTLA